MKCTFVDASSPAISLQSEMGTLCIVSSLIFRAAYYLVSTVSRIAYLDYYVVDLVGGIVF